MEIIFAVLVLLGVAGGYCIGCIESFRMIRKMDINDLLSFRSHLRRKAGL